MYNGIGLQTARGSGTNGYIQTNKFLVRPRTGKVSTTSTRGYEADQGTAGISKKPNKDILEHDRKRQIELKLVVLEDKLIEQGYSDAEISQKLSEARTTLQAASEDPTYIVVSDSKVSDTQSHQIAARKEKQMETLRAALGIGGSERDGQDAEEGDDGFRSGRKIDDRKWSEKREHSFLDRDFRRKKDATEDLKDEKFGKKKRGKSVRDEEREEGEIDDSKLYKEERRKRSRRDKSSDSDSSASEEDRTKKQAKVSQRKHRKGKNESESESETDSDDKRKKRKSKKHKESRRYDSESESSDSADETESESEKKITSVKPKASKRHGVDRNESSSDEDDTGRYNPRREIEKHEKSHQRHGFGDEVKANTKHKGDKYEKSHHRLDSDNDDDVSGREVEVSKHVSEVSRQQSKTRRHDSDDDFDVDDRWKSDDRGGKSTKNRYKAEKSDSDRGGRDTRELTKTGRKRYDTDSDSDAGGDGKSARRGWHDSDDEGNERQSGKRARGKQEILQKLDSVKYESSDDKSSSSSESDSSDNDYKHRKIVQKNHADEKRGRSAEERELRSDAVGSNDRRRATNDDDHRRERSALSSDRYQSKKDSEKPTFDSRDVRSRSDIDDRRREDQQVPKVNNRSAGIEEQHERLLKQDDKFDAQKDDEERDNYSKSGRNQRRDRNVDDDSRISRRDNEPRRESRGDRDYDHHRAERREGRSYQRHGEEDAKTAKSVREDADQLHGSRRRARLEEEDQGSKGREGEYSKRSRYDDSRSSERRRYEDEKRSDDRSRYRD